MLLSDPPYTSYPGVDEVLHQLLCGVSDVLGQRLRGMYLYGSLAGGDFNPATSDIDFIVTSDEEIPVDLVPGLADLHTRLASGGLKWAHKLEGVYLSQQALRRYSSDDPERPHLNEGQFYLARQDSDWVIQRHVLRNSGVVIYGPPLLSLIDPVSPDELRQAVKDILSAWWEPKLSDPTRLETSDYQAYAVLSMCRALYTLRFGEIASKPISARWAMTVVDPALGELICRAMEWYPGVELHCLDLVLDMICYTIRTISVQ